MDPSCYDARMPNLQNAKKALRVSSRKRVVNDRRRRTMKKTIKEAKVAPVSDHKTILSAAYKAIDKAAKGGVIKKNTAARKKSRLAKVLKTAAAK